MHDSQFQVFLFLGFIFFRTYFPETLLAAPILFQEKKSQESKTPDFISSDIFSKDLIKFRLFSKVFISGFFFQKLFFPGLSYIDSLSQPELNNIYFYAIIPETKNKKENKEKIYISFLSLKSGQKKYLIFKRKTINISTKVYLKVDRNQNDWIVD